MNYQASELLTIWQVIQCLPFRMLGFCVNYTQLTFQVNISIIAHFIGKKTRKNTKVQLSQNMIFYKKKAPLKIYQNPQFSRYLCRILTASILDYFYVKLLCILRNSFFKFLILIFPRFYIKRQKIKIKNHKNLHFVKCIPV